jgi:ATP-dependent DNA helicase RecQ
MVDLSRSRLEMVLKVLDVDGAVRRVRGGWESTGRPWAYDAERYERIATARAAEQQAMLDYQSTDGCRMEFLLRQLDDPHAAPCGRCDNCTGNRWDTDVSGSATDAARERLHRPGVDLPARKLWPTGLKALDVPLNGKIKPTEAAEDGRVLARFTDIGWGPRLRELCHGPDREVPDDVFAACVKVLSSWQWTTRPVGVAVVGSSTRPRLVTSLGERFAQIGRLDMLGQLTSLSIGPRPANSARRLAQLWPSLEVSEPLRIQLSVVEGPVLLVDDFVDSGWTMTLAARLLRQAGAPAVLPFALAVAG